VPRTDNPLRLRRFRPASLYLCWLIFAAFGGSARALAQGSSDLSLTYLGSLPEAPLPVPWKLTFASSTEGWVVGNDSLFRTTDGGGTWRQLALPTARLGIFDRQVLFNALLTPSRRGWIVVNRDLFRTDDAGSHWTNQALPEPDKSWHLDGWFFLGDGRHGWAIMRQQREPPPGAKFSPEGKDVVRLYRTLDGGDNWQPADGAQHTIPSLDSVGRLYFRNQSYGVWIGQTVPFQITTDGGATWKDGLASQTCDGGAAEAFDSDIVGIDFIDDRNGWALADDGSLFRTSDGGSRWCQLQARQQIWVLGRNDCPICMQYILHFSSAQEGWIVRGLGGSGFQSFFVTHDGGRHWTADHQAMYPHSGFCLDRKSCWVIAFGNYIYSISMVSAPAK
jgi:photosystem II stability/assembly factor-like uncharacterized protein